MPTKLFFTLALIVAVVLCAANVRAQQTNPPAESKETAEAALREKAFALLKSLAGELGTLQSLENRARIGSNIAGSLWPHDENRARELVALVQQDINTGLQIPENPDPEDTRTLLVFLKLRADTIERIARHDPELAYSFFKATELSSEKELPDAVRENDKKLEANIAKELSASNPNLSLELARKMLASGFPDDLRLLLGRLNRKHKEQARVLYKEIVRKLADTDLITDWPAQYFTLNLANSMAPPAGDEAMFKDVVNLFIKLMVDNACTRIPPPQDQRFEVCQQFAPAIPLIAKVDPALGGKLQHWATHGGFYSPPSVYVELKDVFDYGSADDILALIVEYPQMESDIRFYAMSKAQSDGDLERARKIAAEYTADPERQRMMLARLDEDQGRVSSNNLKPEEVQRYLNELQGTEQKAAYLASVASQMSKADRKAALKLLNQATEIVDTMKPGKDQTRLQILFAILHSFEKSDRGLAMMESLVPRLNELVASAAKLDGYDTHYLRDGEWNMSAEGELGSLLTWLAENAAYFAWCDFDRAVSAAGQFERPEVRMMAQLKVAQGILAGPPKRFQAGYFGYQRYRY